jgi:flavin-dependent dehydrogenase
VRAGAEHVGHPLADVQVGSDGVRLATTRRTYRCSRVVGADGVNSLVRRRTTKPFARADLSIATGYFVFGDSSPDVHVEFVQAPPGYFWSFPRRDHLAVGVCAQADASHVAPLDALVSARLRDVIRPGSRLVRYSWPIPSLSVSTLDQERPAGDRWFLAGDAAGLVDPITREGIFFAIRSGSLAAEAMLGGTGASERYARAVRRDIHAELKRAARLKRGFFASPFTRLLVEALRQSHPVREVMADLVVGEQPYQTLKRRLLATLEIRLAWRLLLLEMGFAP